MLLLATYDIAIATNGHCVLGGSDCGAGLLSFPAPFSMSIPIAALVLQILYGIQDPFENRSLHGVTAFLTEEQYDELLLCTGNGPGDRGGLSGHHFQPH